MPVAYFYLLQRSIKEKSYRKNLWERWGFGPSFYEGSIWIHAVSLGELRAAIPLIKKLLDSSEKVLITTITPAGREEAQNNFTEEIKRGMILVVYLPLEYGFAFSRFFMQYKPKFGIILEYEIWPVMINSSNRHGVPLILAQAQYVKKSFRRDQKWTRLRGALLNGFELILAKSEIHADRFRHFCDTQIGVMGELRFEQPVKIEHLTQAHLFSKKLELKLKKRVAFCFGSTGPGEDAGLIEVMKSLKEKAKKLNKSEPFFIYVPRHKKDFLNIKSALDESGLKFVSRTAILKPNLAMDENYYENFSKIDGLFGDSLGEMNFYFALADFVFIGNSFNNLGAHNIIEPLALKKPVVVGPSTWGIEYPVKEALECNVVKRVNNFEELSEFWGRKVQKPYVSQKEENIMNKFYSDHGGAVNRCLLKLVENGFLS